MFFIRTRLKSVLGQYDLSTDRNTSDNLAWTIESGDTMHDSSRIITAKIKQEEEADIRIIARE